MRVGNCFYSFCRVPKKLLFLYWVYNKNLQNSRVWQVKVDLLMLVLQVLQGLGVEYMGVSEN